MMLSDLRRDLVFRGSDLSTPSQSQAFQDFFVLVAMRGKTGGSFLEIGASDGRSLSNTYVLEKKFSWRGLSMDLSLGSRVSHLRHRRKSRFIIGNAITADYRKILEKNFDHDTPIDYLSLDIEPMTNTLAALKALPLADFKFRVVTYETDFYDPSTPRDVAESVRSESREIFWSHGYELIAGDVGVDDPSKPFEDWWVKPELIDPAILETMRRVFGYGRLGKDLILGE